MGNRPSPNFKINGGGANEKASVAAASTVNFELVSTDGVRSTRWVIIGVDEQSNINDYVINTWGSVGQYASTVALDAGTAAIILCRINAGIDPDTDQPSEEMESTAKFYVETNGELEVLAGGEIDKDSRESGPYGAVDPLNKAIRAYSGAIPSGGDWKDSCRTVTTAALPSYTRTNNDYNASANGTLPSIGGVSLSVGDSVLLESNGTASDVDNGPVRVEDIGSAGTPWKLTRRSDCDSSAEMTSGIHIPITEGTYAGHMFMLTTPDPITINSDPNVWEDMGEVSAVTQTTYGTAVPFGTTPDLVWQSDGVTAGGVWRSELFLRDDITFRDVTTAPTISQEALLSGTGETLTIHSQDAGTGTGGDFVIAAGAGDTADGSVYIRGLDIVLQSQDGLTTYATFDSSGFTLPPTGTDEHIVRWDGTGALQDSVLAISDAGTVQFDSGVASPRVGQATATSGDGVDLIIQAQKSYTGGTGGDLVLRAGDGGATRGDIYIGSSGFGSVYNRYYATYHQFTTASGSNIMVAQATVVDFYPTYWRWGKSTATPTVTQTAQTSGNATSFTVEAQYTSDVTATGGHLYLRGGSAAAGSSTGGNVYVVSGDATTDGSVYLRGASIYCNDQSGATAYFEVNSSRLLMTTPMIRWASAAVGPTIDQLSTSAAANAQSMVIRAQSHSGAYAGGSLSFAAGNSGSGTPGNVVFDGNQTLFRNVIGTENYLTVTGTYALMYFPSLRFDDLEVAPTIYQDNDATQYVVGDTLTVRAQNATHATDGTGGDLTLAAGTGPTADGEVNIQGSVINLTSVGGGTTYAIFNGSGFQPQGDIVFPENLNAPDIYQAQATSHNDGYWLGIWGQDAKASSNGTGGYVQIVGGAKDGSGADGSTVMRGGAHFWRDRAGTTTYGYIGSVDLVLTRSAFRFAYDTASPTIEHAIDGTASAVGDTFYIRAQTCSGSGSTGGAVLLTAGDGVTQGGSTFIQSGGGSTKGSIYLGTDSVRAVEVRASVSSAFTVYESGNLTATIGSWGIASYRDFVFDAGVGTPQVYQSDTSGTCSDLIVHAQNHTGSGAAGDLHLRGGDSASGTDGDVIVRGAVFYVQDMAGTANWMYINSAEMELRVPQIEFSNALGSDAAIQYEYSSATSGTGYNLVIAAQSLANTGSSIGGSLYLRPGDGFTHGNIYIGDGTNRPVSVQLDASSFVSLNVSGSPKISAQSGYVFVYRPLVWTYDQTAYLFQDDTPDDVAGSDMTLRAQSGGTGGAGNNDGGDLYLIAGAGAGTGADGVVNIQGSVINLTSVGGGTTYATFSSGGGFAPQGDIVFPATLNAPDIYQAQRVGGGGYALTVTAQQGAAGYNGGHLVLRGGGAGSGGPTGGNIILRPGDGASNQGYIYLGDGTSAAKYVEMTCTNGVNIAVGGGTVLSMTSALITAAQNFQLADSKAVIIGTTNPGSWGAVRLRNAASVVYRNAAASNDVRCVYLDASDNMYFGDGTNAANCYISASTAVGLYIGASSVLGCMSSLITAAQNVQLADSKAVLFGTTNVATDGELRFRSGFDAYYKTGDTLNNALLMSTNSSNDLTIADSTYTRYLNLNGQSLVRFWAAGVEQARFANGYLLMLGAADLRFDDAVSAPEIYQEATAGATGQTFTVGAQSAATTGGSLYLKGGTGASAGGDVQICGTKVFFKDAGVSTTYGYLGPGYLQLNSGSSAAVSDASTGRVRYNQSTQHWEYSENGSSWAQAFGAGSLPGSGTDNRIVRWNGTTSVQDSDVYIDDNADIWWESGVATPTIGQDAASGAGQAMTIVAQQSTGSTGGSLYLKGGQGSSSDGNVYIDGLYVYMRNADGAQFIMFSSGGTAEWASSKTAAITQAEVPTGHGGNFTVTAQATLDTGSYIGGHLILNGGSAATGGTSTGGSVYIRPGDGDTHGNVVIGDGTNRPYEVRLDASYAVNLRNAGTAKLYVWSNGLDMRCDDLYFFRDRPSPAIGQLAQNSDTASQSLTVYAQSAGAANRDGGDLYLEAGAGDGIGIDGNTYLKGAAHYFYDQAGSSMYGYINGSRLQLYGVIRFAEDITAEIKQEDENDSTPARSLTVRAQNCTYTNGTGGALALQAGAGNGSGTSGSVYIDSYYTYFRSVGGSSTYASFDATSLQLYGTYLLWGSTVANPAIKQANTSGATGYDLTIQAQSTTATSGVAGDLFLMSGGATGTGGDSGNIYISPGTYVDDKGNISLNSGSGPSGGWDGMQGGIFIADVAAVPTAATTNGTYLVSEDITDLHRVWVVTEDLNATYQQTCINAHGEVLTDIATTLNNLSSPTEACTYSPRVSDGAYLVTAGFVGVDTTNNYSRSFVLAATFEVVSSSLSLVSSVTTIHNKGNDVDKLVADLDVSSGDIAALVSSAVNVSAKWRVWMEVLQIA